MQCLLPLKELDLADGSEAASQHLGLEVLVEDVSNDGDVSATSTKPLLVGDAHNHLRSPQWDVVSGKSLMKVSCCSSYMSSRTLSAGRSLVHYYTSFAYGSIPHILRPSVSVQRFI